MVPDCYFCHIKTIEKLVQKFQPEQHQAEDFIFSIHELLSDGKDMINPLLATHIHRIAKNKLDVADLYESEKNNANATLLSEYNYWRKFIDTSSKPLFTAIRLAVVGNIIDYGAHSLHGALSDQISELVSIPLKIDKSQALANAIQKANSILYIGDNAGEIFFDRLLIETMKHPNVTFVTRGFPVINDITLHDAQQVGIDKICKVISNGFDAPSTLLEFCSTQLLNAYQNADLIISKGQGNFEGLMNEKHPNTFFLLIAKCKPMANLLGCSKNDMIVTQLNA